MKITIDTFAKTISVPNGVLLADIIKELEILLPNDKWKEYTLYTESTYFPITIQPLQPYQQPFIWPNQPLPPWWPNIMYSHEQTTPQ